MLASVTRSLRSLRQGSLLALVLLALLAPPVSAQLAPKNGNFFTSSTDISYPGGFGFKIERVYNSKTGFKGMFGFGWGSAYEEFLSPSGSGVVIHEYGGGADNEFLPARGDSSELEQIKHAILAASFEARDVINSDEARALEEKISRSTSALDERLQHFIRAGLMPAPVFPVGMILHSKQFGDQTVERLTDGFRRLSGGKAESFDASGLLTRMADSNGNYVQIRHDRSGNILSMEDNLGRSLTFVYNRQGLVDSIEGKNAGSVMYRYDDHSNLTYARSASGGEESYEYSADGFYNLTSIRKKGAAAELISYYPRDQYGNVKSVTFPDGSSLHYSYAFETGLRNKVTIKMLSPTGAATGESSYEYVMARNPFGVERTQEMIEVVNGERTDTTYNEFNLPVRMTQGTRTTTFDYDGRGQLTRRETGAELKELGYVMCGLDKVKVGFVRVTDKTTTPPSVTATNFDYDPAGNLLHARDSRGRQVSLSYGNAGLVSRLEMPDGTALILEYNHTLKPTQIEMSKGGGIVGAVTVIYKANGEVEKINGGATAPALAKTITDSFHTLSDLIRPAGVSLSL
jgi:YD repeat-containing protein